VFEPPPCSHPSAYATVTNGSLCAEEHRENSIQRVATVSSYFLVSEVGTESGALFVETPVLARVDEQQE